MIVDYKVVVLQNHVFKLDGSSMTERIKREMKDGWQPLGGLATQGNLLMQVLVKYA